MIPMFIRTQPIHVQVLPAWIAAVSPALPLTIPLLWCEMKWLSERRAWMEIPGSRLLSVM